MDDDDVCAVLAECLEPRVVVRHGCAAANDVTALAYDEAQSTVALAGRDGSIQLFGNGGAECTLASACAAPTRFLSFLANTPYVLRVTEQSEFELFDLRSCKLEASALWPGEVSAVCPLPGTAFALVGLEDGLLHGACLRGGRIEPRAAVYGGRGAVVALKLQPGAEDGRVLIAHASGALCLFDLASRAPVALADAGGALTGAAWVDGAAFATAHADGTLRLWSLPEAAAAWRVTPVRPLELCQGGELRLGDGASSLFSTLRHASDGVPSLSLAACDSAAFVVATTCVGEGARTFDAHPTALPAEPGGVHALVAAGTGRILSLTAEEPCLRLLSLEHADAWAGVPLGFPVSSTTCAQVVTGAVPLVGALCAVSQPEEPELLALRHAVRASLPAGRLLVTGHTDGIVRLSDASSAGLPVLATIPVGAGVTSVSVCPVAALCAVCSTAQDVTVFALDGAPTRCGGAPLQAEPRCVVLATAASLLAVGGADGSLTLLDLPACDSSKSVLPLPLHEATSSLLSVQSAGGASIVLVLGAMSSLAGVGCGAGDTLFLCKPKTPAAAVALFAVDGGGAPILASSACMPGHPRVPLHVPGEEDDEPAEPSCEADVVVVCSADAVRTHELAALLQGEQRIVREHAWRTPCTAAQVFVAPGGTCIASIDRALALHILDAGLLRPVTTVALPDIAPPGWTGDSSALFAAGLDGHVFTVWDDCRGERLSEALRLELLEEFSAPEPPPEPPVFWERERVLEAAPLPPPPEVEDDAAEEPEENDGKRRPLFGGKLGGLRDTMRARATSVLKRVGLPGFKPRKAVRPDDLDELFPPPPQQQPRLPPPPLPKPASPRVDDDGRAELLGRGKLRTADEIRQRYGRPARPVDAAAAAGSAASAMGENLQKLNERGEKLQNLQEKTAQLESQAADFAANAKKLREMQEGKGLFGLFS